MRKPFKFLMLLGLMYGLSGSMSSHAAAVIEELLEAPQPLQFESLFCGANSFKNSMEHLEVRTVCSLRSVGSVSDLDYPEAIKVIFVNGDFTVYHLSPFENDPRLTRKYGTQILKAILRGESMTGFALSEVYKEYPLSGSLTREELPLRIFGTLPTGHHFVVRRIPTPSPVRLSSPSNP